MRGGRASGGEACGCFLFFVEGHEGLSQGQRETSQQKPGEAWASRLGSWGRVWWCLIEGRGVFTHLRLCSHSEFSRLSGSGVRFQVMRIPALGNGTLRVVDSRPWGQVGSCVGTKH